MNPATRRILGVVGAVIAACLTVLWILVVPDRADTTNGIQSLAIRWAHPITWVLLTGVGICIALDAPKRLRDALAWSALASYGVFLLALMT